MLLHALGALGGEVGGIFGTPTHPSSTLVLFQDPMTTSRPADLALDPECFRTFDLPDGAKLERVLLDRALGGVVLPLAVNAVGHTYLLLAALLRRQIEVPGAALLLALIRLLCQLAC